MHWALPLFSGRMQGVHRSVPQELGLVLSEQPRPGQRWNPGAQTQLPSWQFESWPQGVQLPQWYGLLVMLTHPESQNASSGGHPASLASPPSSPSSAGGEATDVSASTVASKSSPLPPPFSTEASDAGPKSSKPQTAAQAETPSAKI